MGASPEMNLRSEAAHPYVVSESSAAAGDAREWFAVFTVPQNEQSAMRHLEMRGVEAYLPTYETKRIWKNRQRKTLTLPLFPCYLFAHIHRSERGAVLRSPGTIRIVGNSDGPIAISESEIDFMRSDFCHKRMEPYHDLVIGQKVRIKRGAMQGIEGVLTRQNNGLRFVITLQLINQHAAIEMSADELEAIRV